MRALRLLESVARNLASFPGEAKYRSIKTANEAFRTKVPTRAPLGPALSKNPS